MTVEQPPSARAKILTEEKKRKEYIEKRLISFLKFATAFNIIAIVGFGATMGLIGISFSTVLPFVTSLITTIIGGIALLAPTYRPRLNRTTVSAFTIGLLHAPLVFSIVLGWDLVTALAAGSTAKTVVIIAASTTTLIAALALLTIIVTVRKAAQANKYNAGRTLTSDAGPGYSFGGDEGYHPTLMTGGLNHRKRSGPGSGYEPIPLEDEENPLGTIQQYGND